MELLSGKSDHNERPEIGRVGRKVCGFRYLE